MQIERRTLIGVVVALLATHIGSAFLGAEWASDRQRLALSDHVLTDFMDGLAALAYLEKNDLQHANGMLRAQLDGNLLTFTRLGTAPFDEKMPQAKQRLLAVYKAIRDKHEPIDYSDGGVMNASVDAILRALPPETTRP
jgi:hypothetical protein